MSAAHAVTKSVQTLPNKDTVHGQQPTNQRGADIKKSFQERVIVTVLEARTNGDINNATADFAEKFRFKDYGIGLEFNDTQGLAEFFRKSREFYPDSSVETGAVFVSGDYAVAEWTLKTSIPEPFYGELTSKTPFTLHGASIFRAENGKITEWTDYYDGLTARRTALVSYFTDWVEL
jgi:hypothetical protein